MRFGARLSLLLLLAAVPAAVSANPPQVAFKELPGQRYGIVRLDPTGAGAVELTRGKPEPNVFGAFSWAPTGARLVYAGTGLAGGNLYALDADGTDVTQLTSGAGNQHPAWSPDGRRVAYVHTVRVPQVSGLFRLDADLWLVGADGRNPRRLTRDGGDKYTPRWSPDGTRILFSGSGTWVVDAAGGRVLLHTEDVDGTWSPDGKRIALESRRGIDVIDADGSNRRRVTAGGAGPQWSPDGRWIAFERAHCTPGLKGLCGERLGSISIVGADGRGERRLTGPISSGPGSQLDGFPNDRSAEPVWWPDGSKLFFRRSSQAYAMNADGTCEHPFGPEDRQLTAPAWRPGSTPAAAAFRCADLRARVVPARNPVGVRGDVRVHVIVENDGNEAATAAKLTVRLVYGRGRIRAPSPCNGTSPVVCDLAPLAPGASRRLVASVSNQTPVAFHLRATVTAREPDSDRVTNASVAFVEVLACDIVGTERADRLIGTAGRDRICGLQGADILRAGAGNDTVVGGAGSDLIFVRDGVRDTIQCGAGRDDVSADRIDKVAADCERVSRR